MQDQHHNVSCGVDENRRKGPKKETCLCLYLRGMQDEGPNEPDAALERISVPSL